MLQQRVNFIALNRSRIPIWIGNRNVSSFSYVGCAHADIAQCEWCAIVSGQIIQSTRRVLTA
jgi:hypothetical protein